MVMAQCLFAELRSTEPEVAIDVLAPAWSAGVVGRMAQVDRLISSPFQHGRLGLLSRYRLARSLRSSSYRQAIVLPNSWKSALVPAFARISVRTGYLGEQRRGLLNDVRHLDKAAMPLMVQRFVALGRPASAGVPQKNEIISPQLRVDPSQARVTAQKLGLEPSTEPILALCPGSEYGSAKRWPTAHYLSLARHYLERGWRVIIVGSAADDAVARKIAEPLAGTITNLAGRTTLDEVVDVLSLAQLAITNDSGLMHIAAAVGTPVVAVYGSTDPGFTPPLGETSRVIRLGLECSPCFQRECPLGHLNCLRGVDPDSVVDIASELLTGVN